MLRMYVDKKQSSSLQLCEIYRRIVDKRSGAAGSADFAAQNHRVVVPVYIVFLAELLQRCVAASREGCLDDRFYIRVTHHLGVRSTAEQEAEGTEYD